MILRFKIDRLENVTKLLVATTMGRKKADLVIKDSRFAGMHALLEQGKRISFSTSAF